MNSFMVMLKKILNKFEHDVSLYEVSIKEQDYSHAHDIQKFYEACDN
jgi:hypothetical protein